MSRVPHLCVSHDSYMSNASFICMTWLFSCVTCLIHIYDMTSSCASHAAFTSMTWLLPMCHMPHSYVWHDSFLCVACLIHMCDMTPSYVSHAAFKCMTWLHNIQDILHSYVSHHSFKCVTWLMGHAYDRTNASTVTWLIDMCDMTHAYMCDTTHWHVWHDSLTCVTWLMHTPEPHKFQPPPHCPFYWRYCGYHWPSSTCARVEEYEMTHSTYWDDSFDVLRTWDDSYAVLRLMSPYPIGYHMRWPIRRIARIVTVSYSILYEMTHSPYCA